MPTINLSGSFQDLPSVCSWGPGRTDVFVRGSDNQVYQRWKASDSAEWKGYENLGGRVYSTITAVSWGPNRIDLFARGIHNECEHKWWDGSQWSNWEDLGGRFLGDVSVVSVASNKLDLFVRGTDNAIWQKTWDGSKWIDWQSRGGQTLSNPKAVAWRGSDIQLFIRDFNTNHVMQTWYVGGKWHTAWDDKGGVVTSEIEAVCTPKSNHLYIFGLDVANQPGVIAWTGSWQSWRPLGGRVVGDPKAAAWADDEVLLAVQGGNNKVYYLTGSGSTWSNFTSLGESITHPPVPHPRDGATVSLFARDTNAALLAIRK